MEFMKFSKMSRRIFRGRFLDSFGLNFVYLPQLKGKVGKYEAVDSLSSIRKSGRELRLCTCFDGICVGGIFEKRKVRICVVNKGDRTKIANLWEKLNRWKELGNFLDEKQDINIVRILDMGTIEGRDFIVTDFCEHALNASGGGFRLELRKRAQVEENFDLNDQYLELTRQIGNGYKSLRKMGLICGDIQGKDIIVNTIDSDKFVAKIDFTTEFKEVKGDSVYYEISSCNFAFCTPPEFKEGYWGFKKGGNEKVLVTSKSELWFMGCLLYQLFTGNHPYRELNEENLESVFAKFSARLLPDLNPENTSRVGVILENHKIKLNLLRNRPIEYPEEIPHEMKSLLVKMLEKDPERRISFKDFFAHPLICGIDYEGQDLRERIEYIVSTDELDEYFVKIVSADVSFKCLRILLIS